MLVLLPFVPHSGWAKIATEHVVQSLVTKALTLTAEVAERVALKSRAETSVIAEPSVIACITA